MSWRDFWNGKTTIYANDRHQEVHYRLVAQDIVALIPYADACVIDFGSGDAHSAPIVARACGRLILCDAAENVRRRVTERTAGIGNVKVLSPEELERLGDGSVDVIVVNSVIQYLSRPELEGWLATWRRLLSAQGKLVIGDIVPRSVSPLDDAFALLRFARANGFLLAAMGGLLRTAFSDYRRKRAELGLLQMDEREIMEMGRRSGFVVTRAPKNLGHNPLRLTIIATPAAAKIAPMLHAGSERALCEKQAAPA